MEIRWTKYSLMLCLSPHEAQAFVLGDETIMEQCKVNIKHGLAYHLEWWLENENKKNLGLDEPHNG